MHLNQPGIVFEANGVFGLICGFLKRTHCIFIIII